MVKKTFNPFYVQKFFGQNIITAQQTPGGKLQIATNVIYLLFIMTCSAHAIYANDNRIGDLRYNFISQMRYCMHFYFAPVLLTQISTLLMIFRKQYVHSFNKLRRQEADLEQIDVKSEMQFGATIFTYLLLFASVIPMAAFDIYTFRDKYTVTYFVSQYLPSLAVTVHIIGIATLFRVCASKYSAINNFLKSLKREDLTMLEKFYLNKKNEPPPVLLEPFPGEDITVYQKVFRLHDEVTSIVRLINNMCGYDLAVYMAVITFAMLSFIYDICMDLSLYVKDVELPVRSIYACEYWCVMGVCGMLAIISSAANLMDISNETRIYLHQLRNLYTPLNEHIELFSLQLLHAELKINAAKFFTIHTGIIYKLLSAWITYIIIFMQLDTDISTVEGDD